jgi:hypothetical protein
METNPQSLLEALKDWKHLVMNYLTLALTPALSPGERGNLFPRIGNMLALDTPRFRGSMREPFSGNSRPPRRGENASSAQVKRAVRVQENLENSVPR